MKTGTIASVLFLLSLAVSSCSLTQSSFRKSLDRPEGIVTLPGLSGEARIRRDALGVPYVEATGEDDLFCAVGYASASDRLWQMVFMKMVAQGWLAEIIGKDGISIDIFMRSLGMRSFMERFAREIQLRHGRELSAGRGHGRVHSRGDARALPGRAWARGRDYLAGFHGCKHVVVFGA